MNKKLLLSFFMVAAVCAAFISCNRNNKKNNGEFIFVCSIIDNEYWQSCIRGIERADSELGTHTKVIGPLTADNFVTEIVKYMAQAVDEKPAGIMAYSGIEATHPYINAAVDKGIPFISIDSDAPETKRNAFVGISNYSSGYQAGEAMVNLTGGKAKIGVLTSSLSAVHEMSVVEAFEDAIMDFDMEILEVDETEANKETARLKTLAMLEAHPEITAVFTTGANNVAGAAYAAKEKGMDLALIGFDDIDENLELLRQGLIDAIIVQNPEQMGYQGVHVLKDCVDKGHVSKNFYEIPTILVTKENVDTYRN